jgi:hypothetical protein
MKSVKKIIEVRLNGLNELGVKELNEHYKLNIKQGYFKEFTLENTLGINKKRFKQVKSFENLGLENYITTFDCAQSRLNEDGSRSEYCGPCFSAQLKHFNHEIYEIEITEVITKRDKNN